MINHIHPSLSGSQDPLFGADVATNLFAPFVRRLGSRLDLILAHRHDFGWPKEPVPTSGVKLNDIDTLFDLFTHRFAEVIRPITDAGQAIHLQLPEIGVAIDRVASCDNVSARS